MVNQREKTGESSWRTLKPLPLSKQIHFTESHIPIQALSLFLFYLSLFVKFRTWRMRTACREITTTREGGNPLKVMIHSFSVSEASKGSSKLDWISRSGADQRERKVQNSAPQRSKVEINSAVLARPGCLPDSPFLCDVNTVGKLLTTSLGSFWEWNAKYRQNRLLALLVWRNHQKCSVI